MQHNGVAYKKERRFVFRLFNTTTLYHRNRFFSICHFGFLFLHHNSTLRSHFLHFLRRKKSARISETFQRRTNPTNNPIFVPSPNNAYGMLTEVHFYLTIKGSLIWLEPENCCKMQFVIRSPGTDQLLSLPCLHIRDTHVEKIRTQKTIKYSKTVWMSRVLNPTEYVHIQKTIQWKKFVKTNDFRYIGSIFFTNS